jgi:hypothetical protein
MKKLGILAILLVLSLIAVQCGATPAPTAEPAQAAATEVPATTEAPAAEGQTLVVWDQFYRGCLSTWSL